MTILILLLKGFLIGLAFIIPGVSGGTLAVYLGVYDQILHAIGHIHREFKASVQLLLPILVGVAFSIVVTAKLIGWLLDWNSFITLFFFMGLISGGIASLVKKLGTSPIKIRTLIPGLIAFVALTAFIIFTFLQENSGIDTFEINAGHFFLILLIGMVSAMTMVVPGISGSALLMALGVYTAIMTNVVGNIFDFSLFGYHLFVLIPFGIGVLIGIFLCSKLIEYLLKRFPSSTYAAIIGLVVASIIGIFLEIRNPASSALFSDQTPIFHDFFGYVSTHLVPTIIGIVVLAIGCFIARLFVRLEATVGENIKE
ncbi:MAG: DUF368 domain-containing protein [Candidatus Izemoplasmatales bacterium]|nr:DUF368 domain-containing protein [Candidatus Izemoplasmatales bacterium]